MTISYKDLYKDVKPGDSILIDDGLVGMEVVEIADKDIICIVKNGGDISDHKGVNVPGVELKMPFISPKDREDLLFGIQEDFDFCGGVIYKNGRGCERGCGPCSMKMADSRLILSRRLRTSRGWIILTQSSKKPMVL